MDKGQRWFSMKCPPENECFRGTHNCDKTQTCLDLENGFQCVCKKGYKLNVETSKCMPVCEKGLNLKKLFIKFYKIILTVKFNVIFQMKYSQIFFYIKLRN